MSEQSPESRETRESEPVQHDDDVQEPETMQLETPVFDKIEKGRDQRDAETRESDD